jgi:hypothetical protein
MIRFSSSFRTIALASASASLAFQNLTPTEGSECSSERRRKLPVDGVKYLHAYTGQLTPTQANGPSVDSDGISWQRGAYGAVWIRPAPRKSGDGKSIQNIATAVALALDTVETAIYVELPEIDLEAGTIKLLREKDFAFHRFNDGMFVYYKWMGDPKHDMVPAYSTSIEGVGALLLSPDESKVRLIYIYISF